METVGTRRIRPSLIGTGRNYPTDTGSESVCKEPVGSGRFRPSRNDLGADVKQGRNVTYDRYFSDLNLSKALLERKMSSLGVG